MGRAKDMYDTAVIDSNTVYNFSDDLENINKKKVVSIEELKEAAKIVRKALDEYDKKYSEQ